MSRITFVILVSLACMLVAQNQLLDDETYLIQRKSFPYTYTIRVKTKTEKSEKILNPVRWLPLSELIPDGSLVKKGDVVAKFSTEQSQYELDTLLLEEAVIDANLERRLANIDNKDIDMMDQMGALEDRLNTTQARLDRLLAEPNPDDVRIAEGRLRIAQLNLRAAEKDFNKAKDRFNRGMISRAELDSADKTMQENIVRARFAQREMELTKNPVDLPDQIKRTRLEIDNCNLEIEKLQFEMGEQKKISEIQRVGAQSQKKHKTRELKEKREDIDRSTVTAPIGGYVSHNRLNNEELVIGARMWNNFAFMEIPELSTIGFQGVLLEAVRKHFNEGDKVVVRLNGMQDQPITCSLKTISTLSHDLSEKENAGWNRDQKFGVKVFDVTIQKNEEASWLRPGMVGVAELHAATPLEGPALPLKYVRFEEGKNFIAYKGVYTEVAGTSLDGWFVLADNSWDGKTVSIRGEFKIAAKTGNDDEQRLSASGELDPVNKTDIVVPDIGWWPWPKVTWLVPEETIVKKGDVVAKLDPKERERQIERIETNVAAQQATVDETEKQVELTRINGEFKLKMAKNTLEIAKITARDTLELVRPLPIYRAEMNRDLAKIRLEDTQRKVKREEAKANPTMSPAEIKKLKRDLRRNELNLEKAQLNLEKELEGPTKVRRSRAQLTLDEAISTYETTVKTVHFDNISIVRKFERVKNNLEQTQRRLQRRIRQRDNHTITSPADGLICYNKVFNQGAITKIAVGNTVGPRFNILSIPDLSEMEIKVEVPEKYYPQIKNGLEVEVRIPSLSDNRLQGQVTSVDLLFSNKTKKDTQIGLYSAREPLGEVIFNVRIRIKAGETELKPGLIGEVYFPFAK